MKNCKVDNCDRKSSIKGYCKRHYQQIIDYGHILKRTIYDPNEIILYDDYAEIVLYNKEGDEINKTTVDLSDVDRVKNHKWRLRIDNYVETKINKKVCLLHRFLMNAQKDEYIDHKNRNRLDNRKSTNLRRVTASQNEINKKMQSNNTSGVTGVTWDKSRDKWKVTINFDSKCINLGRYDTLEEAKEVRLKAEQKYHKDFIPLERRNILINKNESESV